MEASGQEPSGRKRKIEALSYSSSKDSEKLRTAKGWREMMSQADLSFEEMFGLTNFQKAIKVEAENRNLLQRSGDEVEFDFLMISVLEKRARLDVTDSELSYERRDVEAFLYGVELLEMVEQGLSILKPVKPATNALKRQREVLRSESKQLIQSTNLKDHFLFSGIEGFDEDEELKPKMTPQLEAPQGEGIYERQGLPSTRFNSEQITWAESEVAKFRDDVLVNIGDPYEWVNRHRDRGSEGESTTITVEYAPGAVEANMHARPGHKVASSVEGAVWGDDRGRPSMQEMLEECKALENDELSPIDKTWLREVEGELERAIETLIKFDRGEGEFKRQSDKGISVEHLDSLESAWERVRNITEERNERWRELGYDPQNPEYDTSFGMTSIDSLISTIFHTSNEIGDTVSALRTVLQLTPEFLHEIFEDLAEAHVLYERGELLEQSTATGYFDTFRETVEQEYPGKGMSELDGSQFVNCLWKFYMEHGLDMLQLIAPAMWEEFNVRFTTTVMERNPYRPKAKRAALLEEVYPHTSIPDESVDRLVASWSITAHAMPKMSRDEVNEVMATTGRILKKGGSAVFFPIGFRDDNSETEQGKIEKAINLYNQKSIGKLSYSFEWVESVRGVRLVLKMSKL